MKWVRQITTIEKENLTVMSFQKQSLILSKNSIRTLKHKKKLKSEI